MSTKENNGNLFNDELYAHSAALLTFAVYLTKAQVDAEELVQDTFLKAYTNMDKFQSGSNAKAWLFTILKNLYINEYRKRKRRPEMVPLDTTYHGIPATSVALPILEEAYNPDAYPFDDTVQEAMASLNANYRMALLLCDIEGFSYEEIADILGIKVGTVRSRLHRGREALKKKLADYAIQYGY